MRSCCWSGVRDGKNRLTEVSMKISPIVPPPPPKTYSIEVTEDELKALRAVASWHSSVEGLVQEKWNTTSTKNGDPAHINDVLQQLWEATWTIARSW